LKYKIILSLLILAGSHCPAQQNNWEYRMLRSLEKKRTNSGIRFHKTMSKVNGVFCLAVPATLYTTGLINKEKSLKENALFITESILVSSAITWSMKKVINRQRPAAADPTFTAVLDNRNHSFPSGHTSEAFSMATSLGLKYPKWYILVPAYSYAAFSGYSRLYLGVHHPTDVLAGAVVGSGSAWLTWKANQWLQRKYDRKKKPAPAL